MPDTNLEVCPFCGGDDIGLACTDGGYQERCFDCEARGPWVKRRTESHLAWKKRALTPKQKAAEEMFDALETMVLDALCSDYHKRRNAFDKARAALAKAGQP